MKKDGGHKMRAPVINGEKTVIFRLACYSDSLLLHGTGFLRGGRVKGGKSIFRLSRYGPITIHRFLQQDHTDTGHHGADDVRPELEETKVEGRDTHRVGRAGRRGGAATFATAVALGGRDGGHGASALGAGLVHQVAAIAAVGILGLLGGAGAVKVAGLVVLAIVLVVGVHGVGQLLARAAHAVGAVLALFGVGLGALAGLLVHAADGAEQLADLLGLDILVDDAGQGLGHALAELTVRRGRELGAGLPVFPDLGALAKLTRWLEVVHLLALGFDLFQLPLEVVEVIHFLRLAVVNLDETCELKLDF